MTERVLELWGRTLDAVERQDLSLIDREIDWAIKHKLVERYRPSTTWGCPARGSPSSTSPTTTSGAAAGCSTCCSARTLVDRVTDDGEIEAAKDTPPQTTRAKLRGDFIAAAQDAGRDFTVDWVHLKLNDQAQRTVLCKDPFRAVDERVDRLIATL